MIKMVLSGKIVVVTGGSKGIGRAICSRFASEGARLVVNYFDEHGDSHDYMKETMDRIIETGGEAVSYSGDVSQQHVVEGLLKKTLDTYGGVDILISNAGICPFEEFLDISESLWDRVNDVNLKGAFLCSQFFAKQMIKQGRGGRILFTSSISSIFGGSLQAHYCPTKGGINQLMKSIAISLGPHKITCNAVLPGTVITDINRKQLEMDNPEIKEHFIKRTPLGELPRPADIASAMLFLASEDARAITGETLVVDGGMSVNLQ